MKIEKAQARIADDSLGPSGELLRTVEYGNRAF
jgi:hypothetical protein